MLARGHRRARAKCYAVATALCGVHFVVTCPDRPQAGGYSLARSSIPCAHDCNFATLVHERNFIVHDMIELEVYAAGVRDLSKILELDHELEAVPGLHYKVDSNHDLVYMELDEPVITFREIRAIFRRLGFEPRFIGAVPPELRPKVKTQVLSQ
jgi:hypothetical protein